MALPLNASFGLNQAMTGIKGLWDQGKVAIVEGIGYPNPSFSHFDSVVAGHAFAARSACAMLG